MLIEHDNFVYLYLTNKYGKNKNLPPNNSRTLNDYTLYMNIKQGKKNHLKQVEHSSLINIKKNNFETWLMPCFNFKAVDDNVRQQ